MLLADREERRNKEHGRSNKRKHHHDEYSSPSKQKTPTMMDMSMLNFQAAQTRKGKTDEIVAHLDLYERFKHILPEDRYHAAVLNCFDNLPSLQTYDVESTSVLTDKSVVSATSVFGNELTPTNTTPIPSFVRMMNKIKINYFMKKKILLIEDSDDIRETTAEILELANYEVVTAVNGKDGVEKAIQNRPDIVICDIMMPVLDGYGVLHIFNQNPDLQGIPFIFLTAKTERTDFRKGMEMGADDYVTKPFRFAVLLARIRAHLRSHEQSEDAVFRIGPYEFRPAAKILVDDKAKKVRLTEKETNILKYLYRAGAKAVSREELLTEVWGYNAGVTTHTLETHIYRLRQKIEPEPGQARLLLTDAGGYRLQP